MPSFKSWIGLCLALSFLMCPPHAQGFDVKALSKLHSAILDDDAAAAGRLLKTDPTLINAVADTAHRKPTSTDGFTPLHYAIHFEKKAVAELLIANGADINAPVAIANATSKGKTPLHLAAREGNESLVKLLVDHKADINGKAAFPDLTPLHEAILHYHPQIAQYLMSKGAPVDFLVACALGKADVITRELQRDPALAHASAATASPLHFAIAGGQKAIADLLLKAGADVNAEAPDLNSRTPLHLAVLRGQLDMVAFLLDRKANFNCLDAFNDTPLHEASTGPIAELLVRTGADVAATNSAGLTALHVAAMRGNADVIKVLLANKADVNAPAKLSLAPSGPANARPTSNTPLHLAAEAGQNQIVQLLVSSGADLTARNSDGFTALGLALRYEHTDTAAILKRLGATE